MLKPHAKKQTEVIHELKIKQIHLIRIITGAKRFEVRRNDRFYAVGDKIRFLPLDDDSYNVYDFVDSVPNYLISYVQSGYGLQDDFVILGLEEF